MVPRKFLCALVVATVTLSSLAACGAQPSVPTVGDSGQVDTVSCQYTAWGDPAKPVDLPTSKDVPASGEVAVTMTMDAGEVTMRLDRSLAPCAINSFVSLAEQGYYDDTSCHRLVPDFVLQCGDPTATGSGGPGYVFNDELTGDETYAYATVAMANRGPDTNGSQFFIIINEDGYPLSPDYDVLGSVDAAAMPVIESIETQGIDPADATGQRPLEGGHISTIKVG
ncbi:MAG: peptidylprolyl isomerase [Propionibacteriaceae bacterium]|jgi:peptidyl-prolyl cis-trans isomerase B (cyclophilin B)|nr:peptidylprolyl isomerase [Propionibacteriaceae bacterium]